MSTVAAVVLMDKKAVSAIKGGHRVSVNEWPWFVDMGHCGGALISHDWVVTAAQCMRNGNHPTRAIMGSHQKNGVDGQICNVQRVIVHPRYNRTTFTYDVALVKLDCRVVYTDTIRAIVLPRSTDSLRDGSAVDVAGYGQQEEGSHSPASSELLAATLYTVSANACANHYNTLDNTMMCAYADGRDSCTGDSGGALVSHDHVLYGLVSYGRGCGREGVPAVYHYVPSSVHWIRDTCDT